MIGDYLNMLPLPTSGTELTQGYYPSAFLILGGLIALVIAWNYVMAEGKGARYRISVLLGTAFAGLIMVYLAIQYSVGAWPGANILLFGILAFTMGFRLALRYNVAFAISLLAFIAVYYGIYILAYDIVGIVTALGVIGIAFTLSILVYALFYFIERGVEVGAGIFNSWPMLFMLGSMCIAEGVLQLFGMSIFSVDVGFFPIL